MKHILILYLKALPLNDITCMEFFFTILKQSKSEKGQKHRKIQFNGYNGTAKRIFFSERNSKEIISNK